MNADRATARLCAILCVTLCWLALLPGPSVHATGTSVTDATGRTVTVNDASRIVSIGGSVTEILYGLGLADSIVGIDTTSVFPPRAMKEKKSVGYMRQLSAEGVLGLRPSLILAVESAGPEETMAVLKAAGVPMVVVPESFSGEGIVEKIRIIAQAAGAPAGGNCIISRVRADLAALTRLKERIREKRRVLFLLSFINGRAMVSGRGTAADGIIAMAGARNAIAEYDGYKPISDEAVIAARPDVVLSMQRAGPGVVTADAVFAHAAFKATPAAASGAFISMNGQYLLGFGPRSAQAARDLAVSLYPDLATISLPSEKAGLAEPCPE